MHRTPADYYVKVGVRGDHRVDFLKPEVRQIFTDDIANGLAKSCRFQGAIEGWYSTAEHCMLGMKKASSKKIALQYLIHDASEYIFSDVSGPIKCLLPDYKKIEGDFQRFINKMYVGVEELDPEVKEIDIRMCATEQAYLRDAPIEDYHAEPYPDIQFKRWEWRNAYWIYREFLERQFPGIGV
jgi:5'-deoxynucleotidase YfbR-like HD superfamily hydrolase